MPYVYMVTLWMTFVSEMKRLPAASIAIPHAPLRVAFVAGPPSPE